VIAARDPLREKLRVLVVELARAEADDAVRARNALDRGPDFGELRHTWRL